MAAEEPPTPYPTLQRQSSHDREQELIKYITDKCAAREEIELEEVRARDPTARRAMP